ncbi:MAG: histidine--tRNA ligase [Sphaerochaetaceae bacterium]|nr:histidine--tRNA ligase [Sphaerochaetaceae bacterium]
MIEPKIPKGFRDSLPEQEIKRKNFERRLEQVFESYGFVPIDTPVLEYTQVLLGKGGGETDKQIFHFTDNGGREVALRFDLTVPLARFVSAHRSELQFPFKRYHIAKVYRGEKPQKGRYREFKQCDFDIVGADTAQSDYEILSLMAASLEALDAGSFKIHISNRALLNDFLKKIGISDKSSEILRAIDKLQKIGLDNVKSELLENGITEDKIDSLLLFIQPGESDYDKVLTHLEELIGETTAAVQRMKDIGVLMDAEGTKSLFAFDPSITRGLDYYTGVVFETFLDAIPSIGSVCSGGRYNNLTGLYSNESLPGVGSCVGIDRLIAAQEELEKGVAVPPGMVDAVIFADSSISASDSVAFASQLRKKGIRCDIYLGDRKMREQYEYAQSKGAQFAIVAIKDSKADIKNLATREILSGLDSDQAASMIQKRF